MLKVLDVVLNTQARPIGDSNNKMSILEQGNFIPLIHFLLIVFII